MFRRFIQFMKHGPTKYQDYRKQGFTVFESSNSVGGSGRFVGSLRPFLLLFMAYMAYNMIVMKC